MKPSKSLDNLSIEKEIRFVGLRRSGNHALINWILRQAGERTLFFNDVDPDRPFDLSRLAKTTPLPDDNVCHCLVYGYEDRLLDVINAIGCYPQEPTERFRVKERLDVIVLRDPFNTFASRLKHSNVPTGASTYISGLSVPQLWITYAHEFLLHTNKMTQRKIAINYNLWCKSSDYRAQIAGLLGIRFSDKGFNDVTGFGRGSSFDALRFSDAASTMKTDARWKTVADDINYQSMFRDSLLLELADRIFDLDDDLRLYIEKRLRPVVCMRAAAVRKLATAVLPPAISYARRSSISRYVYFALFQPLRRHLVSKKNRTR